MLDKIKHTGEKLLDEVLSQESVKVKSATNSGAKVKCSSAIGRDWTKYRLGSAKCWVPKRPYKSSWI